jgi:bacteriorhodopsin
MGSDPARRRSHWPWVLTALFGILGVASAVVRNRWQSSKPQRFALRPDAHRPATAWSGLTTVLAASPDHRAAGCRRAS